MFDFQPRLEEGLATLGLEASVDQVDQLMRFAGLLQKWNKVYNLTAILGGARAVREASRP